MIKDLEQLLKNSSIDKKVKIGVINLFTIIATATEYINQNTLLQYFMSVNIFDTLVTFLGEDDIPKQTQLNILTLLCYFSNFQKYEITNPYLKDLSNLSDPIKVNLII